MMEFADAIRSAGLEPPLSIRPGNVVRFPGIGKGAKNRAAWCKLFDDCMGGVFGDFSSGLYEIWQSRQTQNYTEKQRADFMAQVEASRKAQAAERALAQRKAAKKAAFIVSQAKYEPHSYLDAKGFKDLPGLVWYPDDDTNLLVIPMRYRGELAGCQLIDRDGNKRFLTAQRTNDCAFDFGATGVDIWCEGYATGLSISTALRPLSVPCRVHCCFSANNLTRMAKSGFVVADKDASETGEKAAQATGLPYWLPEVVGEDFNDVWRRGSFAAGMALRKFLQHARNGLHPEPGAKETRAARA